MRWKRKSKPKSIFKVGDHRVVKKFFFLPRCFNDEWRWLEFGYIDEVLKKETSYIYDDGGIYDYPVGVEYTKWVEVDFAPDDYREIESEIESTEESVYIDISKDFSNCPGEGELISGDRFRGEYLQDHFLDEDANYLITINLDGTFGYPESFLRYSFGVLSGEFGSDRVLKRLRFISNEEPSLVDRIQNIILLNEARS